MRPSRRAPRARPRGVRRGRGACGWWARLHPERVGHLPTVSRCSGNRQLPLPDCVGQVGHPLRRLRAERLQGHAARVHALEQADSGAEQHG